MDCDRYEYSNLSETVKAVAVAELNEPIEEVNAHIESFRRWVKSMSHLECPIDASFLLKFLRIAKFDHKNAQKRLDNFCTIRASLKGTPNSFKFFDTNDQIFQKCLNLNCYVPLGRNDAGELIMLLRPGKWDPNEISIENLMRFAFMNMDIFVSEEETQICGLKMLFDLKDMSMRALEVIGDPKIIKQWFRTMQDCYPLRMKGQIFYNEPVVFDIIFQIVVFFMNKKFQDRTFRVKNEIQKAIEKVPGLEKILPKEYGGQGGSIEEYEVKWRRRILEYYGNGNPLSSIKVDETKRPKSSMTYLTDYAEYKGVTLGTAGTYTKFENVY